MRSGRRTCASSWISRKYPRRAGACARPQLSLGAANRRGGQAPDRPQPHAPRQGLSADGHRGRGEIVIRGYRTAEIEARQVARAVAQLLERGLRAAADRGPLSHRHGRARPAAGPAGLGRFPTRCAAPAISGRAWRHVWWSARSTICATANSVDAMSRMGSSRRADIVREQARSSGARHERWNFAAACRLVRDIVATAVPSRASDRDRAEWTSVVEAVTALASSCRLAARSSRRKDRRTVGGAAQGARRTRSCCRPSIPPKGLEWEAVFLVGMEDGVMPHANNDDTRGGAPRRLCRRHPRQAAARPHLRRRALRRSLRVPRRSCAS